MRGVNVEGKIGRMKMISMGTKGTSNVGKGSERKGFIIIIIIIMETGEYWR